MTQQQMATHLGLSLTGYRKAERRALANFRKALLADAETRELIETVLDIELEDPHAQ